MEPSEFRTGKGEKAEKAEKSREVDGRTQEQERGRGKEREIGGHSHDSPPTKWQSIAQRCQTWRDGFRELFVLRGPVMGQLMNVPDSGPLHDCPSAGLHAGTPVKAHFA